MRWNAPLSPGAYAEREIYTEVEDVHGNPIGEAVIDCGKFFWSEDEEFPLFLKSLFQCSNIRKDKSQKSVAYATLL